MVIFNTLPHHHFTRPSARPPIRRSAGPSESKRERGTDRVRYVGNAPGPFPLPFRQAPAVARSGYTPHSEDMRPGPKGRYVRKVGLPE